MAIEAIGALQAAAGVEAAKKAATEAARQIADKVVSNAADSARATQAETTNDTMAQIQQMENQRLNETGGQESAEKGALKQREVEAAESLKGKIEGQAEETPTTHEGGRYGDLTKESVAGTEVHHIPPKSVNGLKEADGPAIRMDIEDHRQTASFGPSNEARDYRAQQDQLVKEGRFEEALNNDIKDLKEKFGDKYDEVIAQAKEYYAKIHAEGKC